MHWRGGFCFRKLSGHNYEEFIGCAGSANQSARSCRRRLLAAILFARAWLRLAAARWRRLPGRSLSILPWASLLSRVYPAWSRALGKRDRSEELRRPDADWNY